MVTITKDTIIGDILDVAPQTAPIFLSIGMHCLGCPSSRGETIAQAEQIKLASVQALGAVGAFTVGVFHTAEKQFHAKSFTGDFESVSLTGTIITMDGAFYAHLHMSAGNERGEVFGGHLTRAVGSATCEMGITLIDGRVDRFRSEEIGLNLFRF